MNLDTGHLISTRGMSVQELKNLSLQGYQAIPPEHNAEADKALDGKSETYIKPKTEGTLSKLMTRWKLEKQIKKLKRMKKKRNKRLRR